MPDHTVQHLGPSLAKARAHDHFAAFVRDCEPDADIDLDNITPPQLAVIKVLAKLSRADRHDLLLHRKVDLPFTETEAGFQEFPTPQMVCLCTAPVARCQQSSAMM